MGRVSYPASQLRVLDVKHTSTPPRAVGSVGCVKEGEALRAANPLAHAGRMLPQSRACGSASLGLDTCLLMLRAPLRERVGG